MAKAILWMGGAREIRVHTRLEHRVIYIAKFEESVYVLHAFREEDPPDREGRHGPGAVASQDGPGHADGATPNAKEWSMTAKLRRSSSNVFRDLGFTAEEAASLKLRADLMIQIRRLIDGRRLTQAAAAKRFGVTQPRISDLVRGKIDLFSIDTLVDMLARAGVRVRLTIQRGTSRRRRREAA